MKKSFLVLLIMSSLFGKNDWMSEKEKKERLEDLKKERAVLKRQKTYEHNFSSLRVERARIKNVYGENKKEKLK